jgi:hypothetical protein
MSYQRILRVPGARLLKAFLTAVSKAATISAAENSTLTTIMESGARKKRKHS